MRKLLLGLIVFVSLFAVLTLPVQASEHGTEIYHRDYGDGTYDIMWSDGSVSMSTIDTAATSAYRYKTIGFTITRCRIDENGKVEEVVDSNGNMEWVEFSLKGASVEVETTIANGDEYNVWTIPGDKLKELVSPEWKAELDNIEEEMGRTAAVRVDCIMTVVNHKSTGDIVMGSIIDNGTGKVETRGLTYWNNVTARCKHCDSDALFTTTLYEGYPAYDVTHKKDNMLQNERICWRCQGEGTGR